MNTNIFFAYHQGTVGWSNASNGSPAVINPACCKACPSWNIPTAPHSTRNKRHVSRQASPHVQHSTKAKATPRPVPQIQKAELLAHSKTARVTEHLFEDLEYFFISCLRGASAIDSRPDTTCRASENSLAEKCNNICHFAFQWISEGVWGDRHYEETSGLSLVSEPPLARYHFPPSCCNNEGPSSGGQTSDGNKVPGDIAWQSPLRSPLLSQRLCPGVQHHCARFMANACGFLLFGSGKPFYLTIFDKELPPGATVLVWGILPPSRKIAHASTTALFIITKGGQTSVSRNKEGCGHFPTAGPVVGHVHLHQERIEHAHVHYRVPDTIQPSVP